MRVVACVAGEGPLVELLKVQVPVERVRRQLVEVVERAIEDHTANISPPSPLPQYRKKSAHFSGF